MQEQEKQVEEMALTMCEDCATYTKGCKHTPCDTVLDNAKALYNAGYRKQSEAHWEIVKGSNGKEKMVCTNCRHQQDLASTFTYCPNCGAKMKGGAE